MAKWAVLFVLLAGCATAPASSPPAEVPEESAAHPLVGFSFEALSDCMQAETRLAVPLARVAGLLPEGYEPLSEAGQAVVRVATWQCQEATVASSDEANVSFSSVSIALQPVVSLDALQEYVLWAGTSNTAFSTAFAAAGWVVQQQDLHVATSSLTPNFTVGGLHLGPADLTVSASLAAGNGSLGSFAAFAPYSPLYHVPPPATVWWHEEGGARQRVAFGLPLRDLGGVMAAGFLTAPPGSPLASLLDSVGQPVVVTLRFPWFGAQVDAEAA